MKSSYPTPLGVFPSPSCQTHVLFLPRLEPANPSKDGDAKPWAYRSRIAIATVARLPKGERITLVSQLPRCLQRGDATRNLQKVNEKSCP